MSRAAKVTLTSCLVVSCGIIWGVHFMQRQEAEVRAFSISGTFRSHLTLAYSLALQKMYQGVLRDDERRREKMRRREEDLQASLEKRAIYESVQHVSKQTQPGGGADT